MPALSRYFYQGPARKFKFYCIYTEFVQNLLYPITAPEEKIFVSQQSIQLERGKRLGGIDFLKVFVQLCGQSLDVHSISKLVDFNGKRDVLEVLHSTVNKSRD
jgi:hypothetical protein